MINIILSTILFVTFSWCWIMFTYTFFWCLGGLQDIKWINRIVGPLVPSFVFFILFQAILMKGLF